MATNLLFGLNKQKMEFNQDFRPLHLKDVETAAEVISQAFLEDPLIVHMLPREKNRLRTLKTFFRAMTEINIRGQAVYGTGEPLQGVAFWKFPDQNVSIPVSALGKFLPLLFTDYPIGYFRVKRALAEQEELYKKYANEPHFSLENLGVLKEARGQGLSSKLIHPFLTLADIHKKMIYTDTYTQTNVALYEHFGFQLMEERKVPHSDLTIWALVRPARTD